MIKTFKHKGLERFFLAGERRLLDAKWLARLEIFLDVLDKARTAEDLAVPGAGLHRLSGDRKNTWSMKVSGNWRLTFRFEGGHAYEVNLEDYH